MFKTTLLVIAAIGFASTGAIALFRSHILSKRLGTPTTQKFHDPSRFLD
jgi:hypothetical protein